MLTSNGLLARRTCFTSSRVLVDGEDSPNERDTRCSIWGVALYGWKRGLSCCVLVVCALGVTVLALSTEEGELPLEDLLERE